MMFFWKLPGGGVSEARRVVERLRQKATDLKWLPVGGLAHLTDPDSDRLPGRFLLIAAGDAVLTPHEVVFFQATLPGDEARPFGLAAYPGYMKGSTGVAPTNLPGWQWIGAIRSSDRHGVESFMHRAAELGLEVTAASGGKVLTAKQDETGEVSFEERPEFSA